MKATNISNLVTSQSGTYLDTDILLSVSSRSFLMIFPSFPMMRPQNRSSANIFSGTSLQQQQKQQHQQRFTKLHKKINLFCWKNILWLCVTYTYCRLVEEASSSITSMICLHALLQFSGWPYMEITCNHHAFLKHSISPIYLLPFCSYYTHGNCISGCYKI